MNQAVPQRMRAVVIPSFGEAEVMQVVDQAVPTPRPDEVLIQVAAAGLNRGDTVQRRGHYPPPPGVTDVPGLEVAGTVVACGAEVVRWRVGDAVCALLAGGGYAGYCVAPADHCLPIPAGVSLIDAASLPETYCTVWDALWKQARLGLGQSMLVHGGSSGIGVTAIQLAAALGHPVYVTAGTQAKCEACLSLGATGAINYRQSDFVEQVRALTAGQGVDVVLDIIGGDYLSRNLACLAEHGRHVSLGVQGGVEASINLRDVMRRRLTLFGTTLRSRDAAYKARLCAEIVSTVWPLFAAGKLKPVVAERFALDDVVASHRLIESGAHIGKILLLP